MKLTRLELKNYRSFADAFLLVDPHATVLMGPNDSGKTWLLQALTVFGARQNFPNDAVRHVPPAEGPPGKMELRFEFSSFDDEEIAHIGRFGFELNPEDRLTFVRTGPRNGDKPELLLNGEVLRELLRPMQVRAAEADGAQHGAGEELEAATAQPEDTEVATGQAAEGEVATGQGAEAPGAAVPPSEPSPEPARVSDVEWAVFLSDALFPILPRIELLPDLKPLPFEVNLSQLAADEPKLETARRLLQLGGVEDLSVLIQDTPDRDELLEHASLEITKKLRQYWTQDTEIELMARPSGDKLRFHLLGRGYPAFTRPQWHSAAFLEYLGIMAALLLRLSGAPRTSILLLDEPGVRLHPRAQRDLVQILQGLSQHAQIIYTAHYPYLIDRNFPGQLRILEPKPGGTQINNKPYHATANLVAWEPIRTALGLTVGDSLLFDEHNVIVEGVTDQMLLCAISQELSQLGDPRALDLNFTAVLPAGGYSNEEALAERAIANELSVVAVFDGEKARKDAIDSYKRRLPDAPEPIWLRDFYNVKYDFCIEDMLHTQIFLDAVNNHYQTLSGTYAPIGADLLGKKKGKRRQSIVKLVEELLPKALAGDLESTAPAQEDSDHQANNANEPGSDQAEVAELDESNLELAKVEVVKEVIALLRERQIVTSKGELRREYERFANVSSVIRQRLEQ
ncbi:MAG: hypothetical protein CEE40_08805 [Chloroflexi bacterium B3_Chlor]|nr:MAG: hypothetical protein CEE40_08805 [Chloroflexi bacterium B3_Chlor]